MDREQDTLVTTGIGLLTIFIQSSSTFSKCLNAKFTVTSPTLSSPESSLIQYLSPFWLTSHSTASEKSLTTNVVLKPLNNSTFSGMTGNARCMAPGYTRSESAGRKWLDGVT